MQRTGEMVAFYRALGFDIRPIANGIVYAAHVGPHKINFHTPELWQRKDFSLRGPTAVPGSGDFCFTWDGSPEALSAALASAGAAVEVGPVERDGGRGPGTSTYTRDPDGNLLEFIIYPD